MRGKFSSVPTRLVAALVLVVLLLVAGSVWLLNREHASPQAATTVTAVSKSGRRGPDTVQVGKEQAVALDLGPVGQRPFANRREALGNIDFNQDKTVSVYTAYQGRIARVLVKAGDEVKAGQVLFTVNVPDIAQASSTLISTGGALRTASETLRRARVLAADDSIAQKELQQNESDRQSAQANYDTAKKSLRLFGLSEADIARVERDHQIDIEMPVRSPIGGRVTARSAQTGLLVQPGTAPAPVTVSDIQTLWMVASVPESELALYKIGQEVSVRVQAYPDRTFSGKVSYVGDTVDANSRRLVVRAEVNDPKHELRAQMSANFTITLAAPDIALAAPSQAVVRESDGSNVVWVAAAATDSDGQRLTRRKVTLGRSDGAEVQIASGLQPGERIARRNALFLSNLYATDTP